MRALWLCTCLLACNGLLGQRPGILDEDAAIGDAAVRAPNSIFGARLVVWLDASAHETIVHDAMARITGWNDRSGMGSHAIVRAAGKGMVSVTVDGAGREAIHFGGDAMATAMLEIADAPSLRWGTNDYVIGIVASWLNPPGTDDYASFGYLWDKADRAFPGVGVTITANMTTAFLSDGTALGPGGYVFSGVRSYGAGWNAGTRTSDVTYAEGRFHVIVTRRTGATIELRVDGRAATNTTPMQNVDAQSFPVRIAGDLDQGAVRGPLQGNIAEVVAAFGSISVEDEDALESYLRAKYRL
jgi:hypothetical protein